MVVAILRACSESSRYFSCHSVGPLLGGDLNGRHLVFRTVGRPVRIVGGDHIGVATAGDGRSCRRRPAQPGPSPRREASSRRRGSRPSPSRRRARRAPPRHADGFPARLPRASGCSRCGGSARRHCTGTGCGPSSAAAGSAAPPSRRSATYSVMTNLPLPRAKPSMCMIGMPSGASSLHGHCTEPTSSSFS